nr:hypothetical protein [Microvirga sp. HBU67692]
MDQQERATASIAFGSTEFLKIEPSIEGTRTLVLLINIDCESAFSFASILNEQTTNPFPMLPWGDKQSIDHGSCHTHKGYRSIRGVNCNPELCMGKLIVAHEVRIKLYVGLTQEGVSGLDC